MLDWFTSSKGAIALSVFGLLTFVAYSFLVSRYLLEQLTPGVRAALVETLIVLALVGFWVWGLLLASRGNNKGWVMLLITSLLPTLFTLYDLVFYAPIPYGWPLLQIVVWVTLVTNITACTAMIVQISYHQENGLEAALSELDEDRQEYLEELKRLLALQQSLFKRETERLTKKLGKDQPRSKLISVDFYHNNHLTSNAELHEQVNSARIDMGSSGHRGWVVAGRITDIDDQGIKGLRVCVFDKDKRWDDLLGYALTDKDGFFAIQFDPASLPDPPESGDEFWIKAVDSRTGKILFTSLKPLHCRAGSMELSFIKREI